LHHAPRNERSAPRIARAERCCALILLDTRAAILALLAHKRVGLCMRDCEHLRSEHRRSRRSRRSRPDNRSERRRAELAIGSETSSSLHHGNSIGE
jgi:hypothetical protein